MFDDAAIGVTLAKRYRPSFRPEARPELLAVLVSRPAFARALLAQLGDGPQLIPRTDLTPFHAANAWKPDPSKVAARQGAGIG